MQLWSLTAPNSRASYTSAEGCTPSPGRPDTGGADAESGPGQSQLSSRCIRWSQSSWPPGLPGWGLPSPAVDRAAPASCSGQEAGARLARGGPTELPVPLQALAQPRGLVVGVPHPHPSLLSHKRVALLLSEMPACCPLPQPPTLVHPDPQEHMKQRRGSAAPLPKLPPRHT